MPAIVESIDISRPPEEVFSTRPTLRTSPSGREASCPRARRAMPFTVGSEAVVTPARSALASCWTEEIADLNPPRSWAVRGVGGPLTAIAKGTIEPLDGGEQSRVTIAIEFEGHGIGKILVPLVSRQARKQLPRNEQKLGRY